MQTIKILSLALFFLSLAACHSHDEKDENAPVLTIENPIEGANITGEVTIHGVVTDESLHEMNVKVTKDSDGAVLFDYSPVVHDETEFHLEASFTTPGLTELTDVTLTVKVEDHNANVTTKSVKFKLKS